VGVAAVFVNADGTLVPIDPKINPGVGLAQKTLTLDAYAHKREAEEYQESENILLSEGSANQHHDWYVNAYNNSWIMFKNVDFGKGAKYFESMILYPAFAKSVKISLRLDSPTGNVIATWNDDENYDCNKWYVVSSNVSGAEGKHDLYICFSGIQTNLDLSLIMMNWFRFRTI
jgi:hypothetical protein